MKDGTHQDIVSGLAPGAIDRSHLNAEIVYNFAGFVNTGVGRMAVVADNNFTRLNAGGGAFLGTLFGLRMNHNGEPLVYKSTQIPFSMVDLVPGCTAISFEVWAATSLIVKHRCAHSRYCAIFTGSIVTTCATIG